MKIVSEWFWQKEHMADGEIFNINKYLFVAKILWEILNLSHLREKSDVNVKTCDMIRFKK